MEISEIPEVAAVISTGWGPSIDTSMRCRARTFKVQQIRKWNKIDMRLRSAKSKSKCSANWCGNKWFDRAKLQKLSISEPQVALRGMQRRLPVAPRYCRYCRYCASKRWLLDTSSRMRSATFKALQPPSSRIWFKRHLPRPCKTIQDQREALQNCSARSHSVGEKDRKRESDNARHPQVLLYTDHTKLSHFPLDRSWRTVSKACQIEALGATLQKESFGSVLTVLQCMLWRALGVQKANKVSESYHCSIMLYYVKICYRLLYYVISLLNRSRIRVDLTPSSSSSNRILEMKYGPEGSERHTAPTSNQ